MQVDLDQEVSNSDDSSPNQVSVSATSASVAPIHVPELSPKKTQIKKPLVPKLKTMRAEQARA